MGGMKNILILLVLAGLGYYGYSLLSGAPVTGISRGLSSSEGVTSVMEARPAQADYALRILFIGNSYTFTHNMPQQMVEMARSDSANRTHYMVQSITKGGASLEEIWALPEVQQLLSEKWDYVVLQQQSFWAMHPEGVIKTIKIAREYDTRIKQAGARTLLFTTWARKPDSHWYSNQETAFLRNADYMQKKFDEQTSQLAGKIGAVAIPVGGYWAYVNNALPDIDLYSADATHPGVAGSYLSAAVFYRYFSGRTLETVSYVPPGISAETAKRLREVVR